MPAAHAQPTDFLDDIKGLFGYGTAARSNDSHPALDPIADTQARFRLEGDGPVSTRTLVPITTTARTLYAGTARAGLESALRGVLNVVEQAAGGADASRATVMNGIAISDSISGHVANGVRAQIEDDEILHRTLKPFPRGAKRQELLEQLLNQQVDHMANTQAHVLAGWMNLGPHASKVLLQAHDVPMPEEVPTTPADVARLVRLVKHEAHHIADDTEGRFNHPQAQHLLTEVAAEANSTHLGDLMQAAKALGVSQKTEPYLLAGAALERTYGPSEQLFGEVLTRIGIEPKGDEARQLMARPMSEITEVLVERLAATSGTTQDQARQELTDLFQANSPYQHASG